MLDSSEKVGMKNWEKIINATIDIASKFDVKTTRFGVIQYQSYPETTIKLVKFNDDKSVAATLKKIFYKSGGKRTDLALNATLDVFKDASVRTGSKVQLFCLTRYGSVANEASSIVLVLPKIVLVISSLK